MNDKEAPSVEKREAWSENSFVQQNIGGAVAITLTDSNLQGIVGVIVAADEFSILLGQENDETKEKRLILLYKSAIAAVVGLQG